MVLRNKNATVVVIGDIGRSPRICYHAKSLADKNYCVQLIGYLDSKPHDTISNHNNIRLVPLRPLPHFIEELKKRSLKLSMLLKFLWVFTTLFYTLLFCIKWPLLVLVQNPPGVPAMLVCWVAARLYRAQFIIDWHNYTYSMFCQSYSVNEADLCLHRSVGNQAVQKSLDCDENSLGNVAGDAKRRRLPKERGTQSVFHAASKKRKSFGEKKIGYLIERFIKGVYYWEGWFGRRADLNFCVTHAMRQNMLEVWDIHSATVYDKPPAWKFKSLTVEQRHELFLRFSQLGGDFSLFRATDEKVENENQSTRFSYRDSEGTARLRDDRPLLLISSTSWTEDEDFGYLLDALRDFDSIARLSLTENPVIRLPLILCVITGKGPMKSYYLSRIEKAQLKHVVIITPWLDAEDYPLLLGSADIGVCLHTSTSGLDLPMKVVDMFGSGLPVIAKRFASIDELVVDGHNGCLFDTSSELCNIIRTLSCGFPMHSAQLQTLASNVFNDQHISWDENWDACVWPLVRVFGAPSSVELARRKRYERVVKGENVVEKTRIKSSASEDVDNEETLENKRKL